uniref:hypothetical protein n=1 Tax=Streptomyces polyasparticus TaxID=2767826 RepID=UPI001F3BFC0C|nr:hypothetical protein [Streptomyces polyasparticus]
MLEIISQAVLENLFKSFEQLTGMPTPQELTEMAGKRHVDLDFDSTFPLIERLGLPF